MKRWNIFASSLLVVFLLVSSCSTVPKTPESNPAPETEQSTTESIFTESESHSYGIVEFPEGAGVPTVDIEIFQDPGAGWNLHIMTENFTFSPEHAGSEHYPGEGHAHLYVDGKKIARVYGSWFHIDEELNPGEHEVEVTLNSNDHNLYTYNGDLLEIKTVITVEAE